jgi:protein gp37
VSENSKIEWCHHTFNIAWGCIKSSPGCDHCYAEGTANRYGTGWGPGAERRTFGEAYWAQPLKWNRRAAAEGVRERVFCSSMTDLFLNDATITTERRKLWPLIEATPNLDWLLLTKHSERLAHNFLPSPPPENIWLGVSVENNDYAWRVDHLRNVNAAVRFLSVEPMLGPVDVDLTGIDWVICGGESGPHSRPMDPQWARDLRDRCVAAGVAFHFKQWGGRDKKAAGRILDGRTWDEYPRLAEPPR